MKKRIFTGTLLICLLNFSLQTGAMVLPSDVKDIREMAFTGCTQIEELIIPEGVEMIGNQAFAGCRSLNRVTLPQTLETVGTDCFSDCAEALYLTVPPDSAAAEWARRSGFDYTANTVCRALVIGQTYAGTVNALYGTANDARAVRFCLNQLGTTAYEITSQTNLSGNEILTAISETFGAAGQDDISLLYYSGHGDTGGELVGRDLANITPSQLREELDRIPGRKVIIVDACYSGNLIEDTEDNTSNESMQPLLTTSSVDETETLQADESQTEGVQTEEFPAEEFPDAFTQAFLSAFTKHRRSAFGGSSGYYVMTAASASQGSEEDRITSGQYTRIMGFFTYALCLGCGWDGVSGTAVDTAADVNKDGAVTWEEAYSYARDRVNGFGAEQTVGVYPAGCTAFSPFRI